MRATPVVLLCALVACARTSAAPVGRASAPAPAAPQDTGRGQPRGSQGRQGQSQEGPRPYRDVITAQAVTDSGVFIVHRLDDKLFYEIPRGLFGREFRLVVDRRGTIRGVGYAGEQIAARVVRWDRAPNRVLLRMVSYAMRADSTLPVSRSVDLSNTAPIIKSFDVAAWSPRDSNVVVEVTSPLHHRRGRVERPAAESAGPPVRPGALVHRAREELPAQRGKSRRCTRSKWIPSRAGPAGRPTAR